MYVLDCWSIPGTPLERRYFSHNFVEVSRSVVRRWEISLRPAKEEEFCLACIVVTQTHTHAANASPFLHHHFLVFWVFSTLARQTPSVPLDVKLAFIVLESSS